MASEPREWYLRHVARKTKGSLCYAYAIPLPPNVNSDFTPEFHVIERAAYAAVVTARDALKAENEQLRLQFKRADLFGLEAILESEQLFKRSCEKLKIENDEARAAHKYELGCQQSIALKLQAQVSGLKDALEFIGCQGFRAKREECTCTRCKALAALKAQRGRDD